MQHFSWKKTHLHVKKKKNPVSLNVAVPSADLCNSRNTRLDKSVSREGVHPSFPL